MDEKTQQSPPDSFNEPGLTVEQLFEKAVRENSRRLLAVARGIVGNRVSPEDVVQQAVMNLYQHRARYDWRQPGGLLRRAVVNEALRILRQPRMAAMEEDYHEGSSAAPDASMIDRETVAAVRKAIDRLPENFRAALVLCEYENMPYAKIAETLDASIPQVKTWIFRARRQLAQMLKEFAGGTKQNINGVEEESAEVKMSVTEHDLELLEAYLDGGLDPVEIKSVQDRLSAEPELKASLEELRGERSMRQAAWQAMEPDSISADRLSWRIQGAMVAQRSVPRRGWSQWKMARMGTAAAACLVFGFFAGRAGHPSQLATPAALQGESSVAVNSNPNPTAPATNAGLLVPVTNEYGQVVAWQPFGNPSDAKAFTEDLHRARGSANTSPADVRVASYEKF